MKFIQLTHHYSGYQVHFEDDKLTLEWFGPIDFTGVEQIGLTNMHIFPIKRRNIPHSAVIYANFIQPTLYNPKKVLSTIRIDSHTGHTPLCNYRGKLISHYVNIDLSYDSSR